jgi:YHS domain-containing protein
MAGDPVYGMTVDEAEAPRSSHGGRTFSFCSPSCQASFDQSPGEYERLADLIPPPLARLPELARNLWWSWHPEATTLFQAGRRRTTQRVGLTASRGAGCG